jgi:hypothetical protein
VKCCHKIMSAFTPESGHRLASINVLKATIEQSLRLPRELHLDVVSPWFSRKVRQGISLDFLEAIEASK